MALLHEAVESKRLDVRLVERNIARGVVSQAQLDEAMQHLADDSENAEWISIDSLSQDADGEPSSTSSEY